MPDLPDDISQVVRWALAEDIGTGDLTADLINKDTRTKAELIAREAGILCGIAWFDEVFRQIDGAVITHWEKKDGDPFQSGQIICQINGPARSILTGERTALNFLQTLSGTATTTKEYVEIISGTNSRILDTRKTLPVLRKAQKYAVACGGGHNHRMGLYDAVLIKENHIRAAGSIKTILEATRQYNVPVEIEVENLQQLEESLDAGARQVLLDNFDLEELNQAVRLNAGRAILETSGNIDQSNLRQVAETGVDTISIGALTKHIHAIDFSLQFQSM